MSKTIQGTFASSKGVEKLRVTFDESTEVITEVVQGHLSTDQVDYHFDEHHLIFSSIGDIHIHAREDVSGKHLYKEDFKTASLAAINGGVTHVCDMPNNPVAPIDDQSYLNKLNLASTHLIPIFLYAGIGPETKPLSYKVPYKAYMGPSVGDLFFKSLDDLEKRLELYKGQWVSFHCEDPETLDRAQSGSDHNHRRPVEAEVIATKAALKFIEKFDLNGKLCHYSAGEGLPLILEAKKRGVKVTAEVTPQHLYFNQETIPHDLKNYFQMNPPIRGESDQRMLLNALKRGELDYLATDHAPHSMEEKNKGTSGLTGLDTYGGFMTWLLLEQKVSPEILSKVCSENPGHFIKEFLTTFKNLRPSYHRLGSGPGLIEVGAWASFSVLSLKRPIKISKNTLKTKCGHSPFENMTFPGSVESVFIGGKRF